VTETPGRESSSEMTRDARLQELGLPLHAIAQGLERCVIFRDDEDRSRFVRRATRVFRELGVDVLAWALMGNHLHHVVRPTRAPLSKAMQRLLGPYAQSFNRRHGRVGRLFRDRFWSRPVEDDDDLLGLIGYVTLNPLRGGLVRSVDELCAYPWTSLAELVASPCEREPLVDPVAALVPFGPDTDSALEALVGMLRGQYAADPRGSAFARDEPGGRAALSRREREDLRTASVHALRLRSQRIDDVLRDRESRTALRLRLERRGWTLDRVIARAAELSGASVRAVRQGGRRRHHSRARRLAAHFAGRYLGCSDAAIARATGVGRRSIERARGRLDDGPGDEQLDWRSFFDVVG